MLTAGSNGATVLLLHLPHPLRYHTVCPETGRTWTIKMGPIASASRVGSPNGSQVRHQGCSRNGSKAVNKFHMLWNVTLDGTLTFKTALGQASSYHRLYVNHRLSNLRKFSIILCFLCRRPSMLLVLFFELHNCDSKRHLSGKR